MNKNQRKYLADKLGDLANLTAAGLILGQFVSGKEIDKTWLILGFILVLGFYLYGLILNKR
ncbi:hypothetical protein HZB97_02915 [Candidatus Gottesmanbacteria bacterium]|nr:hypothetical protein [Candidatus Gottesmanbacteria bacterium]